jgi:chemotaxis protein CheX
MSETMEALETYRAEDFLSLENLRRADEIVVEVFGTMFGFDIKMVDAADADLRDGEAVARTAVVGFSGALRGSCQIRMTSAAATSVASAMAGIPIDDGDSIDDALGELCNMLAGGWKNGIAALSCDCALSPPTVISGRDYKVHFRKPSWQLSRSYQWDLHMLHLTLSREECSPVKA